MLNSCYFGDVRDGLRVFAAAGIRPQTVVTSPPYFGLRDYGHPGQLGLERTPDEYVSNMVEVFRLVREVLADDGTLWLNIGDSYNAHQGQRKETDKAGEKQNTVRGSTAAPSRSVDGLKPKDLIGIPWMLAFALRADGWFLRQEIIWHKPNPMPESVTDRCTKAHEILFLLAKSERYYFDSEAIAEPGTGQRPDNKTHKHTDAYNAGDERSRTKAGLVAYAQRQRTVGVGSNARPSKAVPNGAVRRADSTNAAHVPGATDHGGIHRAGSEREPEKRNRRSVWTIATTPYAGAHFATFPPKLVEPCILAGSRPGDVVLDPFLGSGTTARVAVSLGRQWVGCEINPEYKALQDGRTAQVQIRLDGAAAA